MSQCIINKKKSQHHQYHHYGKEKKNLMKVKHGNKNQTSEPHNFSLFNFQLNEIRTLILDNQSEVPQKTVIHQQNFCFHISN